MKAEKKITAHLPKNLIDRAMKATGEGITPTLRRGLELVASQDVYKRLLKMKGKFELDLDLDELRKDRDDK